MRERETAKSTLIRKGAKQQKSSAALESEFPVHLRADSLNQDQFVSCRLNVSFNIWRSSVLHAHFHWTHLWAYYRDSRGNITLFLVLSFLRNHELKSPRNPRACRETVCTICQWRNMMSDMMMSRFLYHKHEEYEDIWLIKLKCVPRLTAPSGPLSSKRANLWGVFLFPQWTNAESLHIH